METIVIDKSLLDIMQSSMKDVERQHKEMQRLVIVYGEKLAQANEVMLASIQAMKLQSARIESLETILRMKK
jgi:hypothetical protein